MDTTIVSLLILSAFISGTMSVIALVAGWGLIGAFLIYSLGGSMTLVLLAFLVNLRGAPIDEAEPIA